MRPRSTHFAAAIASLAIIASARPARAAVAIQQRNDAPIAAGAAAGQLSGITWLGGDSYLAVADARNELVPLTVPIVFGTGNIFGVSAGTKSVLAGTERDFEGIVSLGSGNVLLADEGSAVRKFNTGTLAETAGSPYAAPAIFSTQVGNRGFESLAYNPATGVAYTANEDALTSDGPTATSSAGALVRVVSYLPSGGNFSASSTQYVYALDPIHGTNVGSTVNTAQTGLSDIVALPDGSLLMLERSVFYTASGIPGLDIPNFLSKIYLINPAAGTAIPNAALSLGSQSVTPLAKTLLWQGTIGPVGEGNLEGLALGGATANGFTLLGITDNQDNANLNARVVAFEITGVVPEPTMMGLVGIAAAGLMRRTR